jgi:hypothetical protein
MQTVIDVKNEFRSIWRGHTDVEVVFVKFDAFNVLQSMMGSGQNRNKNRFERILVEATRMIPNRFLSMNSI